MLKYKLKNTTLWCFLHTYSYQNPHRLGTCGDLGENKVLTYKYKYVTIFLC